MPEVVGSFSALQILLATRNRQYGLLNAPVITFHSPAQVVVEEEIVLRELYYSTLLVVDSKVGTEYIEATEHPAAEASLS